MIIFDKPGRDNTPAVLSLAVEIALQRGIGCILTPSSTGETALLLADAARGRLQLGCISHVYCFGERAEGNTMDPAVRADLAARGVQVVTAAHALSGAERSLSGRFGGAYPVEIMAHTLRMLGQGTKVAVEIAVMACDAGLVPSGQPVIALGGTGRGVDTALILRPQPTHRLLDVRIDELLAKPMVP